MYYDTTKYYTIRRGQLEEVLREEVLREAEERARSEGRRDERKV